MAGTSKKKSDNFTSIWIIFVNFTVTKKPNENSCLRSFHFQRDFILYPEHVFSKTILFLNTMVLYCHHLTFIFQLDKATELLLVSLLYDSPKIDAQNQIYYHILSPISFCKQGKFIY